MSKLKWIVSVVDMADENNLVKVLNEFDSKDYEIMKINTFIESSGRPKTLVVGRLLSLSDETEHFTAEDLRLTPSDFRDNPSMDHLVDLEREKDLH